MLQDIWLTRQPEEFARRFPAWYWLYFEVSEVRVTREQACAVLGVEPDFLARCEQVPAAIHPKAGAYNLLDLIAIAAISQARAEQLPYEFLIRHVLGWNGLAWHALVGAVRGRNIWMAVCPDKKAYYGPYFVSDDFPHPADATLINLGGSVRRVFLENKWPRMTVKAEEPGSWSFSLDGCGRLLLEPLPREGEEPGWPARVED